METWSAGPARKAPRKSWKHHRTRLLVWGGLLLLATLANGVLHRVDREARKGLYRSVLESMPKAEGRSVQVNLDLLRALGPARIQEATGASSLKVSNVVVWDGTSPTLLRLVQPLQERPSSVFEEVKAMYDQDGVLHDDRRTCLYLFGRWIRLFKRTDDARAEDYGSGPKPKAVAGVRELEVESTREDGWTVWELPHGVRLRLRPDARKRAKPGDHEALELTQDGSTLLNAPVSASVWKFPGKSKAPWFRELEGGTLQIVIEKDGYIGLRDADLFGRLQQFLIRDGKLEITPLGGLGSVKDVDDDGEMELRLSTGWTNEHCPDGAWYHPEHCYRNTAHGYEIDTPATIAVANYPPGAWHGFEDICHAADTLKATPPR